MTTPIDSVLADPAAAIARLLTFDMAFFHHVCINALYASAGLLTFVIFERLAYYSLLNGRASKLSALVRGSGGSRNAAALKRRDLLTRSFVVYRSATQVPGISRNRLEDLSAALFIEVTGRIEARLWILDTIVTAAPLIGLLGTILGIMDTFNALSAGGISDPGAVSRGIGLALAATAIGIGTALYGLIGHNVLHRFADHLTEAFKQLILLSESDLPTGSTEALHSERQMNGAQHGKTPALSSADHSIALNKI